MRFPSRLFASAWLLVALGAGGFLVWVNLQRAQRVDEVTDTDREGAVVDAASPTGYAGGKRWLIVPEHNNRSYQWIAETQQMFATRVWRVRHTATENAPFGREVHAASPYRWWLGFVAWLDHVFSGRPAGLAVERAALWADPLLHLLLLAGATAAAARLLGPAAAALIAAGLALLYPLAGRFLPGVPDEHGLAWAAVLGSILPLLAWAVRSEFFDTRRVHRLFFAAGVAGGLGLWISAEIQAPIILGLALGGLAVIWLGRNAPANSSPGIPWRTWALAGAGTCLLAYLAEYFPAHLGLHLQVNNPLLGVAWLGTGELLAQFETWTRQRKSSWNARRFGRVVLALAAVAALPVAAQHLGVPALTGEDSLASRLTSLPDGVVAPGLSAWLKRDGLSGAVVATCLPVLLLVPAGLLALRRQTGAGPRRALVLAAGPVLVALPLACRQLAWWSTFDAVLLALLAVAATTLPTLAPRVRWAGASLALLLVLPGLLQLLPPRKVDGHVVFTRLEVEGLIERALAHWIADHTGPAGAVILVPPDRTVSWCFHGGLRGLGTANWENRDGLAATVRIATATTEEEARGLITQRGVTHLILPSWDSDLEEFARWSLSNPEDAFIMALRHWAIPPWLRAVPYSLPQVAGFAGQSVTILEVTDNTNRTVALSRLAEYFVEMQQAEVADASVKGLQRYPADLSALIALAQVERSRGNGEGFNRALQAIVSAVDGGLDRTLAWDRRVSLAIVLALGERNDLAKEQVRRCLDRVDEARLRSLTTGSLFRLQVLAKAFGLAIADPTLRERAVILLPAELRARVR